MPGMPQASVRRQNQRLPRNARNERTLLMTNTYPTCDHPRLLVKDETCFLCDQIDGQVDAFDHIDEVAR